MPSSSEKQRQFMGAELARKRSGKKTSTGMSEGQLHDFASKPLAKSIENFISKAMGQHIPFIAATKQAKKLGYKDFSTGSEGRAVRDKLAQEIGKKHGVKIKTTWKMEKQDTDLPQNSGVFKGDYGPTNDKKEPYPWPDKGFGEEYKGKPKKGNPSIVTDPQTGEKYKVTDWRYPSGKLSSRTNDKVAKGESGKAIGAALGAKIGDIAEEALMRTKFGQKARSIFGKKSEDAMIKSRIDKFCKSIENKLGGGK